jgi:tRNA-splicing endonuclease subunit Sen15
MGPPTDDPTKVIVPSALTTFIEEHTGEDKVHPEYLQQLALQTIHNLEYQHRWTALKIHAFSPTTNLPLPRPIISGLPPKRLYIHPDEQIDLLEAEAARLKSTKRTKEVGNGAHGSLPETGSIDVGDDVIQSEREWVLPTHLREKWSLKQFADVFDGVGVVPPIEGTDGNDRLQQINKWRNTKRMVLATLQDDSTMVYYIVHDGIVKPRQN